MSWEHHEALKTAINDVCEPIADPDWDTDKLKEKLWQYFRKGGKNLEIDNNDKTWQDLLNDYADVVFSAVFRSCGEKDWINQVDFLLCLDAGAKYCLPKWARKTALADQTLFEQTCLAAYERAWGECRFDPILWEAIENFVPKEGKTPKKIYNAVQTARMAAYKIITEAELTSDVTQHFLATWIAGTIKLLENPSQGDPASLFPPETATQFFQNIVDQEGGMPSTMVQTHGAPDAGAVDMFLNEAYAASADESGATVVSMAVAGKPEKPKKAAKKAAAAWGGEADMGWGKAAWGGKGGGKGWPMGGMMGKGMMGKGMMGKGAWGMW